MTERLIRVCDHCPKPCQNNWFGILWEDNGLVMADREQHACSVLCMTEIAKRLLAEGKIIRITPVRSTM